jgi:hypothetical protein
MVTAAALLGDQAVLGIVLGLLGIVVLAVSFYLFAKSRARRPALAPPGRRVRA